MLTNLVLLPFLAGLIAFLLPFRMIHYLLIILTTATHFGMVVYCYFFSPAPEWNGWVALDSLGLLFLGLTSFLFFLATLYVLVSLFRPEELKEKDVLRREKIFCGFWLFFLSAISLVMISQHLGILWVAIEATTLFSAPLIYFRRSARSLEATWKYLIVCSVGIALGLLGTLFLATSTMGKGKDISLTLGELIEFAPQMDPVWLGVAFIFLLVGYGTKMGLAPMHTWLPDAYSEAPSAVSSLLSGALANGAFLAILRAYQICCAAGQAAFAQKLLLFFGLLSMMVAAVFMLHQNNYKRMLAYSSVEHMGILAFGLGLGVSNSFPTLFHMINHSLSKTLLFFTAGNLLAYYHSKQIEDVKGCFHKLPVTGFFWMAGFLAITGSPPFAPFLSEYSILGSAISQQHYFAAGLYVLFLVIVFIGMALLVLPMCQGLAEHDPSPGQREKWGQIFPHFILLILVLTLGLYMPEWFKDLLNSCAQELSRGVK